MKVEVGNVVIKKKSRWYGFPSTVFQLEQEDSFLGIVIAEGEHTNPRSVLVLKSSGEIIDISEEALEVIDESR